MLLAMVTLAAAASVANAQGGFDRIRRYQGSDSGKIVSMNVLGVTISKGGVETEVPAEQIRSIYLAREPRALNLARLAAYSGRYNEALTKLGEIELDDVDRDEILQEISYYTVYCKTHIALAGQGSLRQAAKEVTDFLAEHGRSFHTPAAIELLGDLLLAHGKYDAARTQYEKLAKATAPYYKARSALLTGRAFQAEQKHVEAIGRFDQVLQAAKNDTPGEALRLEATLDKVVSQSATGGVKQAAETIKKIIQETKPDNAKLLARAYNTLGDCYLQSGDQRAALEAFLHVDLLFHSSAAAHAKALHELAELWKSLGNEQRAQETTDKLQNRYPKSRWALK